MGAPNETSIECIKPVINGQMLTRVKSTKVLGIYLDNCLKFDTHLHKLKRIKFSFIFIEKSKKVFCPKRQLILCIRR